MDGGWGKTLTASGLLRDRPGLAWGLVPVQLVPTKKYLQKWYQQWAGGGAKMAGLVQKKPGSGGQGGGKGQDLGERPALAQLVRSLALFPQPTLKYVCLLYEIASPLPGNTAARCQKMQSSSVFESQTQPANSL